MRRGDPSQYFQHNPVTGCFKRSLQKSLLNTKTNENRFRFLFDNFNFIPAQNTHNCQALITSAIQHSPELNPPA
jgi:hypothetical protein